MFFFDSVPRCDAQPLPVDGVALAPLAVLVFGDVDAVDAVGGIAQSFTLIHVFLPFAHPEESVLRGESKPRSLIVFPLSFVVGSVVVVVGAIALRRQSLAELALVHARRVASGATHDRVVVPHALDESPQRVGHLSLSLSQPVLPLSAVRHRVAHVEHAQSVAFAIGGLSLVDGVALLEGNHVVAGNVAAPYREQGRGHAYMSNNLAKHLSCGSLYCSISPP